MPKILIKNGKIIDGTGADAYYGHLLIDGEKIAALIKEGASVPAADEVIDASGCVVCPGFIDMHSHMDWLVPVRDHPELLKCFLEQGVTTVVGGNCGFSPAPVRPESLQLLDKSLAATIIDKPLDYSWSSMAELLDHIEESAPVLNLAEQVGHATIRVAFSKTRRGKMTPHELQTCLDETRRAFDEGACALSFGLGYDPGMYSPLEEIEAFCKVAAEKHKPVTVHLKALSVISPTYPATYLKPHNLRSLREMLDVAKKTGIKLQLSHFIFVGRRSWPTAERAFEMVERARRDGVDVMIDALPYTSGNTTINVVLPYWFLAMSPRGYSSFWAKARLRAELELGFRLVGFDYRDFQIMNIGVKGWEDLNGLFITEVARKWKTSPFNALLKISEKSHGSTLMLFHSYSGAPGNEGVLERVLSNNQCLFETDALVKSTGYPNPAAMGTFPRILGEYVRNRKLFTIEDAVRRMTSASAERFGIKDRGTLTAGSVADIVVFDPETISDTPPVGSQPAGKPKGIKHVFINGAHVVDQGSYKAGERPGKVIRV